MVQMATLYIHVAGNGAPRPTYASDNINHTEDMENMIAVLCDVNVGKGCTQVLSSARTAFV